MSKTLIPLNALRTLAAVIRHGGVSRAAEHLHLTHSAVSHQVHAVQDALGMVLFEKRGRNQVPTREAAAYVARIAAALGEIDAATQALLVHRGSVRLRISTTPSFAAHWLLPRLGNFIAATPGVDIEVESSCRLANLEEGEVDVALRFGAGHYPGLFSERLMGDWSYPVCSPDFARAHALADPPCIDGLSLLHSVGEPWSWWLQAVGINAEAPTRGAVFSDSSLMLQAAINGQGIGLARESVARDALADGRLVRPFSARAKTPKAHYFVCRKEKAALAAVVAFRQWLGAQIAAFVDASATPA